MRSLLLAGSRYRNIWPTLFFASITLFWLSQNVGTIDDSYDGLWYHKGALVRWLNPEIFGAWAAPADIDSPFSDTQFLLSNYPLVPYALLSLPVILTGALSSSIWINLAGLLLMAYWFMRWSATTSIPVWLSVFACVGLVLNPVAVAQWHTSFLDGLTYYICMAAIFAGLTFLSEPSDKRARLISLVLAAALPAIKVNAAPIGLLVGILVLLKKRPDPRSLFWLFALFVALNWQPYLSNLLHHGNPLYPFFGGNLPSVTAAQVPLAFQSQGQLQRFFSSTFSIPVNAHEAMPLVSMSFRGWDWSVLAAADVRYGGFGPGFGILLVASIALAALPLLRESPAKTGDRKRLLGICMALLFLAVIHPAGWWARYVPYLWAVPYLCLLSLAVHESRMLRIGATASLLLLVGWASLVYAHTQIELNRRQVQLNAEMAKIQAGTKYRLADFGQLGAYHHGPSLARMFRERGAMLETGQAKCTHGINLPHGHTACESGALQ